MLGGCDPVAEIGSALESEAEAEVAVAEAVAAEDVAAEAAAAEAEPTKPLLLGREGVAGVVEQTLQRSGPATASEPPPIADLGRPVAPEGERAFVPYDGGSGAVASAPPSLTRPSVRPRPRPRPRPQPRVDAVDEPCDPALETVASPPRGWDCPACGRG